MLRLAISVARFTGCSFSRGNSPQHTSAGLFSSVRFADSLIRFSHLLLAPALVICSLSIAANAQPPGQDIEVLRVESDLTNLLFTATDKNKRYITTLRESDIRILEDGVPQKLFLFQRETDRPLSIAFLIDVSSSEERTLPEEKAAARVFIENLIRSSKDQAAIIPFEGYAHLEQPPTRDVLAIYRTLERVEVAVPSYLGSAPPISGVTSGPGTIAPPNEGWTAIWDSVYVTCHQVLSRDREQRRRAIILLTDGYDTASRVSRSAAVDVAIQTETVIYAIGIGDEKREGVLKGPLRDIAQRTGGRAFFPRKEEDLRAAFAEIEQELRSQYLIAYSSSNKTRDGAFRTMTIEVTNPELKQLELRYRPGYFAKRSGQ